MLKNYIKIAWRNLLKYKMYSTIKIGGFAFSIAACILIGIYIRHELDYDNTYPDSDRIYRVVGEENDQGQISKGTAFPAPLNKAIQADLPDVEFAGRLMPNDLFYGAGSNQVTTSENPESIYEEGFTYIDQSLLDLLQLPMTYGKRDHALDNPNTMVITQRKAEKFFPGQNPIGKIIYLNNNHKIPYTISGVIRDFPSASHLHNYDFLLTLSGISFYNGEQDNWNASNYVGYLKLKKGTDSKIFEKKLTTQILQKYVIPVMTANGIKNPEKEASKVRLSLQPVKDIHLHSADIDDYKHVPRGDIRYIWLFGGVALFILFIACINFINLSTAKSASRAKEVGFRKVVGSYRSGLVNQFLTESMLYSFLSILVGILFAWLFLPIFNEISGKTLIFPWADWWLLPSAICTALLIGLIAGIYPAFYLSSFRPIQVLKGNFSKGAKNPMLRNGLVIFQFAASVLLIICTMVINGQMQYILNKKIGFDKDHVVILHGTNTLESNISTFKDEIKKLPDVVNATIGDYMPIRMSGVKRNGNGFNRVDKRLEVGNVQGQFWQVDEDYINTLGMQLAAGRNFSKAMATDSQSVIINESMAKSLQLKDPIGAQITNGTTYTVVGVVKDFYFESLKGNVIPLCMSLAKSPTMVAVKVKGTDLDKTIQRISSVWKSFSPHQAIRYTFLDEGYANMYSDVNRTGNIFTSFAVLAIFIACLGLFGLAAFTTEQRTKEIGIRKVLGASVNGIIQLLSKDFILLVFIAIVIASPIAWWAMNKWLEDFANHINIDWWVFALAGLVAIVIALFTVSFQAIKAALANPVKSLRSE
ncbi:ABC transporter permease [Olivibacter domesticus]|uniref:Putative ABC transport system permease protein n=1 Tax=Olivibacter domesticus TaxID=407022 RepID=A0A1H7SJJ6_OLID1|nr:ABC transporter permease [Olivibacter domesticus]SEL71874.1 putative ABC transport system permease protein [Olivibacter domesticus]